MVVDVVKRLKRDAAVRQQRGMGQKGNEPTHERAHKFFVSNNWRKLLDRKPNLAPKHLAATKNPVKGGIDAAGGVVALDCEMVGVGPGGNRSVLARVSIVDRDGAVLLDTFVRPTEFVTDFRTQITGITPATFKGTNVREEADVRQQVAKIIKDSIVVGHALHNDFEVLRLMHPLELIRDTSTFRPLRPPGREGKMPSLKGLSLHWLSETIHGAAHNSIEDARMALRLYKLKSRQWEKQMKSVMRKRITVESLESTEGNCSEDEQDCDGSDHGEPINEAECDVVATQNLPPSAAVLPKSNPGKKKRKTLKTRQEAAAAAVAKTHSKKKRKLNK
mmetsp:Transcript_13465/g.26446  ORF Transcript_13465/g.26446 Transcript_13465/m.26446 type:complete len:333 (-) Transcript_13465:88-1086(-)